MRKLISIFRINATNTPLVFIAAGFALLLVVIIFHQNINQPVIASSLNQPLTIQSVEVPIANIEQEITQNKKNITTRPPFPKDAGYSIQFLYNETYPDPPFFMME